MKFVPENDPIDVRHVAEVEQMLEDVIEISDPILVQFRLNEMKIEPEGTKIVSAIDALRNAIILHEAAAQFFSRGSLEEAHGYANQSLSFLIGLNLTTPRRELKPIIYAYISSSQMQVAMISKKVIDLRKAISFFNRSVSLFKDLSILPHFLRAKAYLNLPWYFFARKRKAKLDFSLILAKSHQKSKMYNPRIISFSHFYMAKLMREERPRVNSHYIIDLLDKAIIWDPTNIAARDKAEIMKTELVREYNLRK